MKYKKIISLFSFMLCIFSSHASNSRLAFTVVPVADLIGQPLKKKNGATKQAYDQLPLCGANLPFISCPRIHQLIFNEVVEILDERGAEVKIAIPHLFYINAEKSKIQSTYWTLKDNLVTFEQLKQHNLKTEFIPQPILFSTKYIPNDPRIVTLAFPYYDSKTRLTFSAGTRFVQDTANSTEETYTVSVFDKKKFAFRKVSLPKKICLRVDHTNRDEQIQTYVQLIRAWTKINDGFIPYVWGGCSFTALSNNATFSEQNTAKKYGASYYALEDYKHSPKPGFDCTNLIARATQMCGIPYFFKNSTTVAHYMKPVPESSSLSEGDLIWVPRHVMVVGSLEHNTLLEARHYGHGYGKVQEIALGKVFKGIETYDQLFDAFLKKEPLYRMDNKGEVKDTFSEFKILTLSSVWE